MNNNNSVFISYSHADMDICRKICNLFRELHVDIWHDEEDIPPAAEDFDEKIEAAIDESPYFVCVMTSNIKHSEYCGKELKRALEWRKRNNNRCVFIFKMEQSLDNLTDLPPGCNLMCTDETFNFAYTDDLLVQAVNKIANYLFDNFLPSVEYVDARQTFLSYASQECNNYNSVQNKASNIKSQENETVLLTDVAQGLMLGQNYFLEGERGTGKTIILESIYKILLQKMIKGIQEDDAPIFVPIYVKMEMLWEITTVVKRVLYLLCKEYGVPYCVGDRVNYIVIIDGNVGSNRGYLPESIHLLMNPESKIYSSIIAHSDNLLLPNNYLKLKVELLSFSGIVKYVKNTTNDLSLTSKFFQGLLANAFAESSYVSNEPDDYFKFIKNIYNIFSNDNCVEKGGSLRVDTNDFYNLNLAWSTQRGRLPCKLSEDEAFVWKKLITGNEVFSAIRNPYYLNWLIKLFLESKNFVFPCRLSSLQVLICRRIISDLEIEEELKKTVVINYLHELAVLMYEQYHGNHFVEKDAFRARVNDTNFENILGLVAAKGFIVRMGTDLNFTRVFMYDYFLQYTGDTNIIDLETNLRTCPKPDFVYNYLQFVAINDDNVAAQKDPIEIATRIALEERSSFSLTKDESAKVRQIAEQKLAKAESIYKKESILTGVGLLYNDLSLVVANDDLFNLANEDLWLNMDGNRYLLRYPITNYHFQMFIADGYQNAKYWLFGKDSLLMKDGRIRSHPIPVDKSNLKVFAVSNHPVVGITWYEANAFCHWLTDKIGLPSDNVVLPSMDMMRPFLKIPADRRFNGLNGVSIAKTTPIGVFGEDSNHLFDIIGNTWEWSSSGFAFEGDYIQYCYGGAWGKQIDEAHLETTYPAKLSSDNIGFRIVVEKKRTRRNDNDKSE